MAHKNGFTSTSMVARPGSVAAPWQLYCSVYAGARPGSVAAPWQLLPRLLEHSGRHCCLLRPRRLSFCVSLQPEAIFRDIYLYIYLIIFEKLSDLNPPSHFSDYCLYFVFLFCYLLLILH